MEVAIIGLGRMGMGMGARLAKRGHKVWGYDVSPEKLVEAEKAGIKQTSLLDIRAELSSPRIVIVMVPSGEVTEAAINEVLPSLSSGDILIDGGNSDRKSVV